ncbi:decaprenyl-phosphate phosphoribosyltransferase [bacterium]|nr:decaprenyl-phosphate phosphoribosyltransferase [candidate division CSSED10-310 bacterium]
MLGSLIETMRPRQWTKNSLVFAGILFSLKIFHPEALIRTLGAFLLFCLISGSVYILNDILDRGRDRLHPEKRHRPIASGRLSIRAASVAGFWFAACSLGLGFTLSSSLGWILFLYMILNIAYSLVLKNIVILDVLIIALGFVLRAVAGAVVIEVEISEWLLICTFLLALFLALCKRRYELIVMAADRASNHRAVLAHYSSTLVDQMIAVVTASALMAYALYTISDNVVQKFHTQNLIFTVPFVLFAIFRYLFLVLTQNKGGSPERVLIQDKAMVIDILLWVLAVIGILYFA